MAALPKTGDINRALFLMSVSIFIVQADKVLQKKSTLGAQNM
jgi:hypothetical protein